MSAHAESEWKLARAEARQLRRLAPGAGGRVTLCWSPGAHDLPIALALAGFLVVALEDTPEEGARLMEKASVQRVLPSFQIYLRSPERVVSEALDLYHLVAIGAQQALNAPPHVISGLYGRLAGGGALYAHKVPTEYAATVASKLRAAGSEDPEEVHLQGWGPVRVLGRLLRGQQTTVNLVFRHRG